MEGTHKAHLRRHAARTDGDITAADLLRLSPFCDMDIMGLFGAAKFAYVKQLINGLHKPVM